MTEPLNIQPLSPRTWPAFAALVDANGGIWGGCWCLAFHGEGRSRDLTPEQRREAKRARVGRGDAHAALVFRGQDCLGWAQYGSPAELPQIHARRAYEKDMTALPDWRLTCLFVGKGHRGQGVARKATEGAIAQIAGAGGGIVEAYPETTEGRKAASAFLWCGTLEMYQSLGFQRDRQIGKHKWVMRAVIAPEGDQE